MHRIVVCLQGATTGAELCDVTVVATPKTDAKTSRLVCHLTEIAFIAPVGMTPMLPIWRRVIDPADLIEIFDPAVQVCT